MKKDEDANRIEPRLLNAEQLAQYLGLGRNAAVSFARYNGCIRKWGTRTLFDKRSLDRVLDEMGEDLKPDYLD